MLWPCWSNGLGLSGTRAADCDFAFHFRSAKPSMSSAANSKSHSIFTLTNGFFFSKSYSTLKTMPALFSSQPTNMNGERGQFAVNFAGCQAPQAAPYMVSCSEGICGRSGQCWRLGQTNQLCGPRQPYMNEPCSALRFPTNQGAQSSPLDCSKRVPT